MCYKIDMNKKTVLAISLVIIAIIGLLIYASKKDNQPGVYDTFASCVAESGAKFYGAFWCPNCQNQKKMFGSSAKLLPYVECSTADGRSQTPQCTELGIEGYPTWRFADGNEVVGVIGLEAISTATSCPLPITE